eukprot:5642211-Amphidinium_carterae.1
MMSQDLLNSNEWTVQEQASLLIKGSQFDSISSMDYILRTVMSQQELYTQPGKRIFRTVRRSAFHKVWDFSLSSY